MQTSVGGNLEDLDQQFLVGGACAFQLQHDSRLDAGEVGQEIDKLTSAAVYERQVEESTQGAMRQDHHDDLVRQDGKPAQAGDGLGRYLDTREVLVEDQRAG